MAYVSHPLIKEGTIEKRAYQEKILAVASGKNSLVVLPTGLGKTIIAAMLSAYVLSTKGGKVLFMAPTKPLVLQHRQTFETVMTINPERMNAFTGAIVPEKRKDGYKNSTIIFATPQVIENDIITRRLKLSDFSLIIFDEAHRATGDYAYVFISHSYRKSSEDGLILGITASPGYERSKVNDIISNLFIENVYTDTESSPDVSPYIHDIDIEWIKMQFPSVLEESRKLLKEIYDEKLSLLLKFRLTTKPKNLINKRDLLALGETLRRKMLENKAYPQREFFIGIKAHAAAIKVSHALELLETQGPQSMISYFDKVNNQKSKSSKELLRDRRVQKAIKLAREHDDTHPKIEKLKEILTTLQKGKKAIVFTQFRESAKRIVGEIKDVNGIIPARFIGQATRAGDEGLSQKRQKDILDDFRNGTYNVLVATSVAEEGLDIPAVDLVVFFEPIPSEIRTIQRRGRTGRRRPGRVVILTMKDTMDEAYFWVAKGKEKKMRKLLGKMEGRYAAVENKQAQLEDYVEKKVRILCDSRENPQMIKLLSKKVQIDVRMLEVGDYLLSDRIGVERKSTDDFLRSLFEN
ncbi:MAG: helicase-related protein, partial [Candidatus Methanofastidiosia archaeon]